MDEIESSVNVNPVLVALDLSERSEQCLKYGCEMAEKLAQPLIVLHVAHESGDSTGMYRRYNQSDDTTPIHEIAKAMLKERIAAFRDKCTSLDRVCDVQLSVVNGIPDVRINEYAELCDASMIVMCRQTRRGLSQFLHGSVTQSVMRRSSRPVVAIGPEMCEHQNLPLHSKTPGSGVGNETATGA